MLNQKHGTKGWAPCQKLCYNVQFQLCFPFTCGKRPLHRPDLWLRDGSLCRAPCSVCQSNRVPIPPALTPLALLHARQMELSTSHRSPRTTAALLVALVQSRTYSRRRRDIVFPCSRMPFSSPDDRASSAVILPLKADHDRLEHVCEDKFKYYNVVVKGKLAALNVFFLAMGINWIRPQIKLIDRSIKFCLVQNLSHWLLWHRTYCTRLMLDV